ncbi:MAG: hypothetical protein WEB00_03560 [Dehalococcoidia bacterium]
MNTNAKGIIDEAAGVIDRYLTLVETEVESKVIQRSGRYVCGCHSCSAQRKDTLDWLTAMNGEDDQPEAA